MCVELGYWSLRIFSKRTSAKRSCIGLATIVSWLRLPTAYPAGAPGMRGMSWT